MAARVQKQKQREHTEGPKPTQTEREGRDRRRRLAQDTEYAEAVKHEMDEILSEVDEILEDNESWREAEAFVRGFVQKGGQ